MFKTALIYSALAIAATPAHAHARHHHHHHSRHYAHRHHHTHLPGWRTHRVYRRHVTHYAVIRGGIITVSTAAGIPITVAASLAGRFQSLIADFVTHGYHPRHIGCFARGGHVRNSRHYAGAACDFDQRGWGKTVPFMYTAEAHQIIAAHGFRDGRAFHDQGHVDDGGIRYARNVRHSRFGG